MAKGNEAKSKVIQTIAQAFGEKFVGEIDKKVYVWSEEGGEPVQVCLTLTCPKNPVGAAAPARTMISTDGFGLDFENMPTPPPATQTLEYTQEEKDTIEKLIKELGL